MKLSITIIIWSTLLREASSIYHFCRGGPARSTFFFDFYFRAMSPASFYVTSSELFDIESDNTKLHFEDLYILEIYHILQAKKSVHAVHKVKSFEIHFNL